MAPAAVSRVVLLFMGCKSLAGRAAVWVDFFRLSDPATLCSGASGECLRGTLLRVALLVILLHFDVGVPWWGAQKVDRHTKVSLQANSRRRA